MAKDEQVTHLVQFARVHRRAPSEEKPQHAGEMQQPNEGHYSACRAENVTGIPNIGVERHGQVRSRARADLETCDDIAA